MLLCSSATAMALLLSRQGGRLLRCQCRLKYASTRDGSWLAGKIQSREEYNREENSLRPGIELEPPVAINVGTDQYIANAIALRDLCQCPKCVDSSSRQKLFCTAHIPRVIKVSNVSYDSGKAIITWNNDVPGYGVDHRTILPLEAFQRLLRTGKTTVEQSPIPRVFWDAQQFRQATADFEYGDYMASDSTLLHAARQLQTHGLLFITGVPEDEESVVRVGERIGPLKTTFYGKTWDVRSVPEAKNVAYTAQNLGFHMDLMYMQQPPHLQLLHCIRSSSAGGASLFTDSFHAARDLYKQDPEAYSALSKIRVEFHYDHPDHYYHQTRRVLEERPLQFGAITMRDHADLKRTLYFGPRVAGKIRELTPLDFLDSIAWSPPFQAPFQLDSNPSDNPLPWIQKRPIAERVRGVGRKYNEKVAIWHAAAQQFDTLIHRPEVIYERLMQPGELVIFDNRRVLHARKAFEVGDAGKERWLRGAYIDKDPFVSKLKVLRDRLEN